MQKIEEIFSKIGRKKEDFSVCLGCKICASLCPINEIGIDINPQHLLLTFFLEGKIEKTHPLLHFCVNCYRCVEACPWEIRVPELIRVLRYAFKIEAPFDRAFKESVRLFGRVYEPYVLLRLLPFILKNGYLRYIPRWIEFMNFHLPKKTR